MDLMKTYLFEMPWWLAAVAIVAAVAVLVVGLLKGNRNLRRIGAVSIVLAVAWLGAGMLVVTPREQAIEATHAIVTAYDAEDWTTLKSHINEFTRFDDYLVGEQIVTAAQQTRGSLNQEGAAISDITAVQDPAGVRVRVTVTSRHAGPIPRLDTLFQFQYVLRNGELMLDRITPMDSEQFSADQLRRHVVSDVRRR